MDKNNFDNKINIDNYTDLEGVSTKKLDRGLWLLEHKELFRKGAIILLIVIGGVSWAYTIYGFSNYLIFGIKEDNKMLSETAAFQPISHQLILNSVAKDLDAGAVQIFNPSENKFDFLIQIVNPNQNHWATFDYYFSSGGGSTLRSKGFVLPGETKYLVSLGNSFDALPSDAQFKIERVFFQRINPREISDWQTYKDQHLNVEIKDIKFTPARSSGLSEKIGLSQLEFSAINKSAFNYWQIGFLALMLSQGNVVGVNLYSINDFQSGETRLLNVNYPDQLGRVESVQVTPEVNIMDKGVYKNFDSTGSASSNGL